MNTPNRLIIVAVLGCAFVSPVHAQFGNLLKGLAPKQPDAAAQQAQAAAEAQAAMAQAQAAAKPAREVFSKSVAPEQAAAMGLSKLSAEELAQLDANVMTYAAQAQSEIVSQMTAAMGGKGVGVPNVPAATQDESTAPGFLGIPGAPKLGIPGMDGTPVTAESLLEAVAGGGQFFLKANLKYAEAILPAERVKEINDMVAAQNAKSNGQAALSFIETSSPIINARAEAMLKEGKALSEQARALIAEGNAEIGKGIVKWAVLTVMIAKTFKLGGNDEKMLAAIVVAKNAMKDIVDLKKLQSTMTKLSELKDSTPAEVVPAEAKS